MKMKLRPILTQQQTSRHEVVHPSETTRSDTYVHPWYEHVNNRLNRPNPPSKEDIEKAKFVDKTYRWNGDDNLRSGNKRSSK